jgi:hypothetical protein
MATLLRRLRGGGDRRVGQSFQIGPRMQDQRVIALVAKHVLAELSPQRPQPFRDVGEPPLGRRGQPRPRAPEGEPATFHETARFRIEAVAR